MHFMGYCEQPPALVFPYMERLSLFHALHQAEVSSTIIIVVYTRGGGVGNTLTSMLDNNI